MMLHMEDSLFYGHHGTIPCSPDHREAAGPVGPTVDRVWSFVITVRAPFALLAAPFTPKRMMPSAIHHAGKRTGRCCCRQRSLIVRMETGRGHGGTGRCKEAHSARAPPGNGTATGCFAHRGLPTPHPCSHAALVQPSCAARVARSEAFAESLSLLIVRPRERSRVLIRLISRLTRPASAASTSVDDRCF